MTLEDIVTGGRGTLCALISKTYEIVLIVLVGLFYWLCNCLVHYSFKIEPEGGERWAF